MGDDTLSTVIIDLCSRKFLLLSDQGQQKTISCEDTGQFMRVLKVCTDSLDEEQIKYESII